MVSKIGGLREIGKFWGFIGGMMWKWPGAFTCCILVMNYSCNPVY